MENTKNHLVSKVATLKIMHLKKDFSIILTF